MNKTRKNIPCLITCYYDTNYIRTTTLVDALSRSNQDFIHVKNSSKGIKQYWEVIFRLIKVRLTKKPDIYYLTFRGYEILPIVRLITIGRPLVFDEFINPIELVVHEQKIIKNAPLASVARVGYRLWLNTVQIITTDTDSHAEYSANLMKLPLDKYIVLPVGTDEKTFDADKYAGVTPGKDKFQVFYYGSMLPLHGVENVLGAMKILKNYEDIELMIVGGKAKARKLVDSAKADGSNIAYKEWIDYEKLPEAMKKANVCLGGPFGDTVQSQFVITGKTYQQLSLGCPVIIGKNRESDAFIDKENVLIAKQGSAESLVETILWAYEHSDKLAEIGQNGKLLYDEKFSMNRLGVRVSDLFTNLIENR